MPKTKEVGLDIGLEEFEVGNIPSGRYTAKIIKDLGEEYVFEIMAGEHKGKTFTLSKPKFPPQRRHDGLKVSPFSGDVLH